MKKISLVSTHDYLPTMGFVRSMLENLSREYKVVIFENKNVPLKFQNDLLSKVTFEALANRHVISYVLFYLRRITKFKSHLILTVGQWGIVLGYLNKVLFGTEFINLNDELEFRPPVRLSLRNLLRFVLYQASVYCGRSALYHITQDEYRARFLKLVFGIQSQVLTLPNSTRGSAEYRKGYFLHERFGLNKQKKITLWSASSTKIHNSGIIDLINIIKNEEFKDLTLFIHLRDNKAPDSIDYLEKLIKTSNTEIIISRTPFSNKEYDKVIQSIDIGIVMYYLDMDMGPNVNYICKSSGQLNGYLKYGKPCLIQDLPGFRLLNLGGCTKIIEQRTMLSTYFKDLLTNYERFSNNAVSYYNRNLSFDFSYIPIKQMLDKTLNHG